MRSDTFPSGFTFIEILVALSLIAVLFLPTMQLFSHAMEATTTSRDLITAVNLARWEMERVKNLGGVSLARLKTVGNSVWPPDTDPALQMNGQTWRIVRILRPDSDPLEVTVEVHRAGEPETVVRLVTLLADRVWESKTPQTVR